jgi:hypothetical protein
MHTLRAALITVVLVLGLAPVAAHAQAQPVVCAPPDTFTTLVEGDIDLGKRPDGTPAPLVQDTPIVRVAGYREVIVYIDLDERVSGCSVVIAPRFRSEPGAPFAFSGSAWPSYPTTGNGGGSFVAPGRVRVDGNDMSLRARLSGSNAQLNCNMVLHYTIAGVK